MQKHVNLVDLVKSFPTNIYLQNLASIQKRTSPLKFAHLAEKSGKGSISNLSTKAKTAALFVLRERPAVALIIASRALVDTSVQDVAALFFVKERGWYASDVAAYIGIFGLCGIFANSLFRRDRRIF